MSLLEYKCNICVRNVNDYSIIHNFFVYRTRKYLKIYLLKILYYDLDHAWYPITQRQCIRN